MDWTAPDVKQAVELIRNSPMHFISNVLGEEPYEDQLPIINAMKDNRRVAVVSGHSCGKDWLAPRLGLWFHCAYYPSIVVATGPTDRQVKNVVWGELATAYNKARSRAEADPRRMAIGGRLLTQELQSGDPAHYMIGYTAKSAEAFQGFHSDNVLIIVTEASGIEPDIWKGINSLMTARGNAKLLVVGNPLSDADSEFYQMCTAKSDLYKVFTLDSERSPYCSREWIEEMKREFGENSPMYRARVKGEWPEELADTLMPISWLHRAQARWEHVEEAPGDLDTLGLDVARFGSDVTSWARVKAKRLWIKRIRQGQDLMQTAGDSIVLLRDEALPDQNLRLDDTGLGGGVTDRLREQGKKITPINFGSSATDEVKFANARTEMFWCLREAIRDWLAIDPKDSKLLRDLSVIRYKMTSKGQIKLEEKAEIKRRLGYSPDRADSAALAVIPNSIAQTLSSGGRSNMGLLEYMKLQAQAAKGAKERGPVTTRPVTDTPGAAVILEASREHVAPRYDESGFTPSIPRPS